MTNAGLIVLGLSMTTLALTIACFQKDTTEERALWVTIGDHFFTVDLEVNFGGKITLYGIANVTEVFWKW